MQAGGQTPIFVMSVYALGRSTQIRSYLDYRYRPRATVGAESSNFQYHRRKSSYICVGSSTNRTLKRYLDCRWCDTDVLRPKGNAEDDSWSDGWDLVRVLLVRFHETYLFWKGWRMMETRSWERLMSLIQRRRTWLNLVGLKMKSAETGLQV